MGVQDANSAGFVHGGTVMRMLDEAAGIAAIRHCKARVVTAGLDRMTFTEPVYVGDLLRCQATVNAAGRTSMEVGVRVETVVDGCVPEWAESAGPRRGYREIASRERGVDLVVVPRRERGVHSSGESAQRVDRLLAESGVERGTQLGVEDVTSVSGHVLEVRAEQA